MIDEDMRAKKATVFADLYICRNSVSREIVEDIYSHAFGAGWREGIEYAGRRLAGLINNEDDHET